MPKTEPFNENVSKYEEWFDVNVHAYRSELNAIRYLMNAAGTGVEIGVGTGRFAAPLGITTGVEPSAKMAAMARERGISVLEGVAERLPFPDGQFDFALMVTTICFLDDVSAAMKEAFRILRPEGNILIGFVDKDSRIGRMYQSMKDESVFYRSATFFSVPEVTHILEDAGFSNLKFAQTLFTDLDTISGVEPVVEGYGKGAFVVIRAEKRVLSDASTT